MKLQVTACTCVQDLWKYGFSKSSDNLYTSCILQQRSKCWYYVTSNENIRYTFTHCHETVFVHFYIKSINFYVRMEEKHNRFESDTGSQHTTGRHKLLVVALLHLIEDALWHESTFISPSISAQTRGCNKSHNTLPPVRHVLAICGNQGQGQTNICIIMWFTSSFDLQLISIIR
jgi:hypothetical protein